MSFDVSDLPSPENRTSAQWVTFYLRLEAALSVAKSVMVGGTRYEGHELDQVVKQRREWEARAAEDVSAAAGRPKRAPVYVTF